MLNKHRCNNVNSKAQRMQQKKLFGMQIKNCHTSYLFDVCSLFYIRLLPPLPRLSPLICFLRARISVCSQFILSRYNQLNCGCIRLTNNSEVVEKVILKITMHFSVCVLLQHILRYVSKILYAN